MKRVNVFFTLMIYGSQKFFFHTYTDRRTGLPVVSVIHLDTGDFVVPLELISWVTLKGHRIPWLTAISTSATVHWHAWVPAGCGH